MNRRKKKLIRLDLQLKVVLITFFVTCFALLINFQLIFAGIWSLAAKLGASSVEVALLEDVRAMLLGKFLITLGISIPLAISVGIIYSFTFSGPIYRFKKYFGDLATGRWDEPLRLRTGDLLQDVCDSINSGLEPMRDRLRTNHEVLQAAQFFLEEAQFIADSRTKDALSRLRERIAVERAAYQARLGTPPAELAPDVRSPADHVEQPA